LSPVKFVITGVYSSVCCWICEAVQYHNERWNGMIKVNVTFIIKKNALCYNPKIRTGSIMLLGGRHGCLSSQ